MRDLFAQEDDPRVEELTVRLEAFYQAPAKYTDFEHEVASLPDYWPTIKEEIGRRLAGRAGGAPLRVLEFGAGRTGFGTFLGELRGRVHFEVQDITPMNRELLREQADEVHIGPITGLKGPYDVILSTFAYEHISNPRATLEHLFTLMAPGGTMFIATPRYGVPGYTPPPARHYGRVMRMRVAAWVLMQRVMARIDRRPRFLIHLDPSVFRRPWYRDADAVHWVSILDYTLAAPPGYRVKRIRLKVFGWRRLLWEKVMLAFVRIDRDAA